MFQIKIERNKVSNKNFFAGVIYSSKLIDKSIERRKMIKTLTSFKIGISENGIPHKCFFKKKFTFLELVKIFEIASQVKNNKKLFKAPAWNKIVEKKVIPGRNASSLAGTYRKFIRLGEEKALKDILQKGRYSHHFQYPPSLSKEAIVENTPSTQAGAMTSKEISPIKADLLSDEEEKEEEPEVEEEESVQEFLLAVDDLESVLSYRGSNDRTYNLSTNIKKLEARSLDEAFTQIEEDQQYQTYGCKRVKISEDSEISSPIYDTNDLHNY